MLGTTYLKSSFVEKDLDVLVNAGLYMSQQHALAAKKDNSIMTFTRIAISLEEVLLSLLSTSKAASGILCPFLGSPIQERCGHAGKHPAKSHKMIKGLDHLMYKG